MTLDVGDKAPQFALETDSAGTITNADLKGKAYVIYFYPKDDTPGCTKEAIGFTEHAADFAKAGVTVIGVSKDSVAKHAKFREKYDLGVLLGSDPEGEVIARFGSWVEKSMYGRKYMGIDRSTFLVDAEGIVRAVWRKVKVKGHVEAVLKAAQAL